jgi:putative component of toxin-antitoxin plasmid stabilization module
MWFTYAKQEKLSENLFSRWLFNMKHAEENAQIIQRMKRIISGNNDSLFTSSSVEYIVQQIENYKGQMDSIIIDEFENRIKKYMCMACRASDFNKLKETSEIMENFDILISIANNYFLKYKEKQSVKIDEIFNVNNILEYIENSDTFILNENSKIILHLLDHIHLNHIYLNYTSIYDWNNKIRFINLFNIRGNKNQILSELQNEKEIWNEYLDEIILSGKKILNAIEQLRIPSTALSKAESPSISDASISKAKERD